ncbi:nucleotide sugar dehydrogenase [Parapedobacter sp. 10938]|uniref:nucleotide sugar dehydrogenase n=1 Tax=Parapedobacter flavus TaxID=3110225 RepID=UPI002DBE56ED|nr:nucleotide sugar dehydrogenase [Parapedobacter sp. 10938]MEC3880152.1 nucleotide sugar dehydrogenase [Parapedobacter sp. 10938]
MSNSHLSKIVQPRIAVIGLGYVGLPLAIEFGKKYEVLGFDISGERVKELSEGKDRTHEANLKDLHAAILQHSGEEGNKTREIGLSFSSDMADLKDYDTYIVTVPTPIDQFKAPDLTPLIKASEMLGTVLSKGNVVIYESTVYPGCTEEDCVPVLERVSGLRYNIDFFAGYSPERINPGDKINTLTKIKKVTSGSTPEIAERVDELYQSIIEAGTHKAPSIKVAEASKAIENAQRDVNISFVNELSLIFDRIGIDTNDVIEAAATKWNFLKYQPGLVGGHCIGVDPYYLAHKAQSLGYHPQVILSGRRVNDQMGAFVADKVVKLMIQKDHKIKDSRALIMGITFKENCPDIRNTRVVDIYHELVQFGLSVDVYDPWADPDEVKQEYGLDILNEVDTHVVYDAIVVAVAHSEFLKFDYQKVRRNNGVIFDTKACLNRDLVDGRL